MFHGIIVHRFITDGKLNELHLHAKPAASHTSENLWNVTQLSISISLDFPVPRRIMFSKQMFN